MECDLTTSLLASSPENGGSIPAGYSMVAFDSSLIRQHAAVKYESFCHELDSHVFPCLGRKEGCLRLMREIVARPGFAPEATWLCRYGDAIAGRSVSVGTIQGLEIDGWGAIQNLGIVPDHRGRSLGSRLLMKAADGFRGLGLTRMHLEVTTDNHEAIRLYTRLGFRKAKVVYKASEILGAGVG